MTGSEFLKEITNAEIGYKREQSLRNYSTWRIGGTVQYLLLPRNEDELAHILRLAHKYNIELPIIGQGSNILFRSGSGGGYLPESYAKGRLAG